MSQQLTTVTQTEFDAQVKHAYQTGGKLRNTVTLRTKVTGGTYDFRKMNKGIATPRLPQTNVVPMNIGHSKVTATLSDWCAPEYTDLFMQAEVNYDEQKELAFTIANALGRREDQIILDAVDAATATNTVGINVGGTNTGLNMAKLRQTKRLLDDQGCPSGDRYFTCSAVGMNDQLLGTTEATSADYNTVKALVQGEVETFVGFKFIMIESRSEGGLVVASNQRVQFAWHKDSVGLAVGIDMRTEINYVPEKTSHLANGLFKAGSAVRDTTGMVEVTTYE